MTREFYIDKTQGVATFFIVKDGIVIDVKNKENDKFNKVFYEKYLNKHISNVISDFSKSMQPVYYGIKPNRLITFLQNIYAFKSQIDFLKKQKHIKEIDKEDFSQEEKLIKKYNKLLYEETQKFIQEKELLKNNFNFNIDYQI